MAQTDDILLTEPGEALQATVAGDFVVGDASNKFIKYIVLAAPGHYKMYPEVGVGIWAYVNSNMSPAQLERAIRLQLEDDIFVRPQINASQFPITGDIYINRIQIGFKNGS